MRLLDVANKLNKDHPVDVISTFLGAHAIPEEMNVDTYVDLVCEEMIPLVKNRAEFCDVFCENGFFSYDQSKQILEKGKDFNLTPKVHADELSDVDGGVLAAEVNAISAEHLLKIKVGNLRLKVYEALKLHKSQFFTKDMGWQSLAMKNRRTERYGVYSLNDKGNFYNF